MHVFGLSSWVRLLLPCLLSVSGSVFAQTHNNEGAGRVQQRLVTERRSSSKPAVGRMEGAIYQKPRQAAREEAQVYPPSAFADLSKPIEVVLPVLSADEMGQHPPKAGPKLIGVSRSLPGGVNQLAGGAWSQLPDGSRVWRLAIRSLGAAAIRVHFREFDVGSGQVWIHDGLSEDIRVVGPYSGSGPFADADFWTGTVASEVIVIEYVSAAPEAPLEELPFQVAEISHIWGGGFEPAGGSPVFPPPRAATCAEAQPEESAYGSCASPQEHFALGDALWCHRDASCLSSEWESTRNAVAHIIFVDDEDGEAYMCSGTLLMNQRRDFTPYFLTAAHCVNSEREARSVEAYWFYETDRCNGQAPPPWNVPRTEGALLLATQGEGPGHEEWREGDASLLLLNEDPPAGVAFSGWEGSQRIPVGTRVTGIHHPAGDFRRYSSGVTVPNEIARTRNYYPAPAAHMTVDWLQGLTEPGSSGSGLFSEPGILVGIDSASPKPPEGGTMCDLNPAWTLYARFSEFYPEIRQLLEAGAGEQPELGGTLTPGVPATYRIPSRAQPTIFVGDFSYQLDVPEGVERVTLTLRTNKAGADVDLFARYGEDVDLVAGEVVRDHESIGPAGDEEIVIDSYSNPPLRAGTYYVSLLNWTTNTSVEGTLLATFQESARAQDLIPGTSATFQLGPRQQTTLFSGGHSYRLQVPPDATGVRLSLRTTPPDVDVDLHVRFGQDVDLLDGQAVDDYSSTGLTGNEDIYIGRESDPPLRPGTYYIAFGLHTLNRTAQCTLSAELVYGDSAAPMGRELRSGQAVRFTLPRVGQPTLYSGSSAFWIQVPDGTQRLDVELSTLTRGVDVDLYLRHEEPPQLGKGGAIEADASSRGLTGQEYITLTADDGLRAGTYYIATLMYSENAAAEVQVEANVRGQGGGDGIGTPLQPRVPTEFTLPAVDRTTFFGDKIFRIEVPETSQRLTVDLETLTPGVDVDLFIRYGDPPYVAAGSVVSHFASQSLTGREQIVISADTYPPLWPGTYYIGLAVFTEGRPATCRVTASVERGERQDIGRITTPAPGSTLPGSAVSFRWVSGPQVEQYYLKVGTTLEGGQIYQDSRGTTLAASVTGIPTGGQLIYVRLYSRIGHDWFYNDYTYTACSGSGCRDDLDIAEMISPPPGSTLPGSTVTFEWDAGSGGFNLYRLMVGSSRGGNDIFEWWDLKLSVIASGVPTDGRTIYVRLGSRTGDSWFFNDYVYTAASGEREDIGRITAPPRGSTLSGSTVTFTWAPGSEAEQYYLKVGTTSSGGQIYEGDQGDRLSATVSGIPTGGQRIYVRLYSRIGQDWLYNDYTYTAASGTDGEFKAAEIISPTPGSTLTSSTVTFRWSAGKGVSAYHLKVSDLDPVVGNIYNQPQGQSLSATVSGIPTDGRTIRVRLASYGVSGEVDYKDYTYTAHDSGSTPGGTPAEMTSPPAGSTLPGDTVTFRWSAGVGVTVYHLMIGSQPGGKDIYDQSQGQNRSVTVPGLPTDGRTLYVRLHSTIGTEWPFRDYTYTAYTSAPSGPSEPAQMTSPAPGSTLPGNTVTFQWSAGVGVSAYHLKIGSQQDGGDIYDRAQGQSLLATVSGIPVDGRTIYVRLFSQIGQNWHYKDYTYTAWEAPAGTVTPGLWRGTDVRGGNIAFFVSPDGSRLTPTGSPLASGSHTASLQVTLRNVCSTGTITYSNLRGDGIPIVAGAFETTFQFSYPEPEELIVTGTFESPVRATGSWRLVRGSCTAMSTWQSSPAAQ